MAQPPAYEEGEEGEGKASEKEGRVAEGEEGVRKYISYRVAKQKSGDGRRMYLIFVTDNKGTERLAASGIERIPHDGHYTYRNDDNFQDGGVLVCHNLSGCVKWLQDELGVHNLKESVHPLSLNKNSGTAANASSKPLVHSRDDVPRYLKRVDLNKEHNNEVYRLQRERANNLRMLQYGAYIWLTGGQHEEEKLRKFERLAGALATLITNDSSETKTVLNGINAFRELSSMHLSATMMEAIPTFMPNLIKLRKSSNGIIARQATFLHRTLRAVITRNARLLGTKLAKVPPPQIENSEAAIDGSKNAAEMVRDPSFCEDANKPGTKASAPPAPDPGATFVSLLEPNKSHQPGGGKDKISPSEKEKESEPKRQSPPQGSVGKGRKLCEFCSAILGAPCRTCTSCGRTLSFRKRA